MRRLGILMALGAWAIGCSDGGSKDTLPDWSRGYEDDSEPDDNNDTDVMEGLTPDLPSSSFGLGIPWEINYPVRLRQLDTEDTPCAIRDDEFGKQITCVLEMDELDLYVLGLTYEIVVPEGMCDFLWYSSYMFENWQVGVGPTEVSWVVDPSDTENRIKEEVNSRGGAPYCPYDYTPMEGPNCCVGFYNLMVTNLETGDVTTGLMDWGGTLADCYAGAAYLDTAAEFSEDGFPKSKFIYVDRSDYNLVVTYKGLSDEWSSNVLLANYTEPEDHNGAMPAAYTGFASQPMYEFECLDDAWEVIARIELVVREWNEETEFDIDGDPNTTGVEEAWDHPIDDVSDWATLTPDDETYPELYH